MKIENLYNEKRYTFSNEGLKVGDNDWGLAQFY